jgi:hypothetical protein
MSVWQIIESCFRRNLTMEDRALVLKLTTVLAILARIRCTLPSGTERAATAYPALPEGESRVIRMRKTRARLGARG